MLSLPQPRSARAVLAFWFDELTAKDWFRKDPALDARIRERFSDTASAAARCELTAWRQSGTGRLAEIIVLDQFSRNIHRDTPAAFAQDNMALALAQEAVRIGIDRDLSLTQRRFLYMPFMHSESAIIHEHAVTLFSQPGLEESLRSERLHRDIIARFGRYPHRNNILGRTSTAEELAFLQQPGSSF